MTTWNQDTGVSATWGFDFTVLYLLQETGDPLLHEDGDLIRLNEGADVWTKTTINVPSWTKTTIH